MLKAAGFVQAAGSLYGGAQAQAQARAQADTLDVEAQNTMRQTMEAESIQRRQARQFLSRQRAAMNESGAGATFSSRKLMEDSAVNAEMDALPIRYAGLLRRQGLRTEASFARERASSAMLGAGLSAGANILGGYGAAGDYQARRRLVEG